MKVCGNFAYYYPGFIGKFLRRADLLFDEGHGASWMPGNMHI